MDKRIGLAISLSMLLYTATARSATQCTTQMDLVGHLQKNCISSVETQHFYGSAKQSQYQSQWCWAATISMIFSHAGFPITQEDIVREAYGEIVNLPVYSWQLAENLNKTWIDAQGRQFKAQVTGLYDAYIGLIGMDNQQLIDNLNSNKPLIIGANGHAMVVTSVSYTLHSNGKLKDITQMDVYDPWPGRGHRVLKEADYTPIGWGTDGKMQFLATIDITAENPNVNTIETASVTLGSDKLKTEQTLKGSYLNPIKDTAPSETNKLSGGGSQTLLMLGLWFILGVFNLFKTRCSSNKD